MRKIKLTKGIYELYQELERLEDVLDFSVFYPLSRAFESRHFLPGFHVNKGYFEIHEDDSDELVVLRFGYNARLGDEGFELTNKEVEELVEQLKEVKL
jgi:hypothetical protein